MFVPAPIDKDFVPPSSRRVLRRHASVIIDGTSGKGSGGIPRVVPQFTPCGPGSNFCTPCGPGMVCDGPWGSCVAKSATSCP
jgi:hypothetical protein